MNDCSLSCSQTFGRHFYDEGCLTYASTVNCNRGKLSSINLYFQNDRILSTATFDLPIAWYRGFMVVGWCRTKISASNSREAVGFSDGDTITIPLRIWDRFTWREIKKQIHDGSNMVLQLTHANLFQGERSRLSSPHFLHRHPFSVDTTNGRRREITNRIGS